MKIQTSLKIPPSLVRLVLKVTSSKQKLPAISLQAGIVYCNSPGWCNIPGWVEQCIVALVEQSIVAQHNHKWWQQSRCLNIQYFWRWKICFALISFHILRNFDLQELQAWGGGICLKVLCSFGVIRDEKYVLLWFLIIFCLTLIFKNYKHEAKESIWKFCVHLEWYTVLIYASSGS